MSSPYRDNFRIRGFHFGDGKPTVAIVGTMRGDEIQQQYVCSQIVNELRQAEAAGEIVEDKSVLVIPTCNPFSMNVSHRFWSMDSTDINRMFPGYEKGETTQRIAAAIFDYIKNFDYGLQMASFYMPGDFIPHVRMLKTGYEDVETAKLFGFPMVTLRAPLPYDTTLLNYNWQLWNCKAFSIYAGKTDQIDGDTSRQTIAAIMRFLNKIGVLKYRTRKAGYESVVVDEADLINIKATHAGIFRKLKTSSMHVEKGKVLCQILDPYTGDVKTEVKAPCSGDVFFVHNKPLCLQNAILYRLIQI